MDERGREREGKWENKMESGMVRRNKGGMRKKGNGVGLGKKWEKMRRGERKKEETKKERKGKRGRDGNKKGR